MSEPVATPASAAPPPPENDDASAGRAAPLAWGQYGEPIKVPPAAQGWRVRRFVPGARGGAPEVVYCDGIPLMLPIESTAEDLRCAVGGAPGRYRLEAIDQMAESVPEAPHAFSVIAGLPPQLQAKPASDDVLQRLMECNQKLVDANVAAIEKVTQQMAHYTQATSAVMEAASRVVNAADSAGVTRRELPEAPPVQVLAPYVPGPLEPAPKPEDPSVNWLAQIAQHGPSILAMASQIAQAIKSQMVAQSGAAPTPPTNGGEQ